MHSEPSAFDFDLLPAVQRSKAPQTVKTGSMSSIFDLDSQPAIDLMDLADDDLSDAPIKSKSKAKPHSLQVSTDGFTQSTVQDIQSGGEYEEKTHIDSLVQGLRVQIPGKIINLKVLGTGWGFGRIKIEGGIFRINGECLGALSEGSIYNFYAKVERHPTYGLNLKIDRVTRFIPSGRDSLVKYLQKNYKGIGKGSANKIVTHFEQVSSLIDLRDRLVDNPYKLDFSHIIGNRKVSRDLSSTPAEHIYDYMAVRIGGADISDKLLRKLAVWLATKVENSKEPNEDAWALFSMNPYEAIRYVSGYGFRMADSLAKKFELPKTAPERLAALATYAIDTGCNTNGHTYLTFDDFRKQIHEVDIEADAADAIEAARAMGEPLECDLGRYYLTKVIASETNLALELKRRLINKENKSILDSVVDALDIDLEISNAEKEIGFKLDQSQYDAVKGVLCSKKSVHTITAGPGCGKTTIMEFIVVIMRSRRKQIYDRVTGLSYGPYKIGFCAPTGKAAKVLGARVSRIGAEAKTIHSMLGVEGGGVGGFKYHHRNRMDFDLLVVDESSMVDLQLMQALVTAQADDSHIVFLGDPQQLPSVGPGACLADLIGLDFDHHHLDITHRNDGGILEVVNLAGKGQMDFRQRCDVTFLPGLPQASEEEMSGVLDQYDQALKNVFNDFSKVGLLIARRKGDISTPGWNVTYLNHHLREKYNPKPDDDRSFRSVAKQSTPQGIARGNPGEHIHGTRWRVRDRIIIRKNLTLKQQLADELQKGESAETEMVVNGDTGYIYDYQLTQDKTEVGGLILDLDDGRQIFMPLGDVDSLDLAYAMTVHSAQGSEYQHVFFICVNGTANFIHRGIVFTALSRAQKHLTIIGEHDVLRTVVKRAQPVRNSYLIERVTKWKNATTRFPSQN